MAFMEMRIYKKGALYAADCEKCGRTNYTHEWITDDHNERRDAMQEGTARCEECGGAIDADSFVECGQQYAGRYSADGYMDCTDWHFDTNKKRLEKELRDCYGD